MKNNELIVFVYIFIYIDGVSNKKVFLEINCGKELLV